MRFLWLNWSLGCCCLPPTPFFALGEQCRYSFAPCVSALTSEWCKKICLSCFCWVPPQKQCFMQIKCLRYAWFVAWHNFLIPLRLGRKDLLTWFQPYYLPSIGTFGYGSLQTVLSTSACPLSQQKATLARADPVLMYLTSDQRVCPQHLIFFSYTVSIWLIIPVKYK